jgi:hypothetical protein
MRAKFIRRVCLCTILFFICLLLTGCPNKPVSDYQGLLESAMNGRYGTNFGLPVVSISYQTADGTQKIADFQLDGFDYMNQIGYQFVTEEDKALWEQAKKDGQQSVPDLADIELIQQAAIKYKFPVLFIYIKNSDSKDWGQIIENQQVLSAELSKLSDTPEMIEWAQRIGN